MEELDSNMVQNSPEDRSLFADLIAADGTNIDEFTDTELIALLEERGAEVGPITATTKSVYKRKLLRLLNAELSAGNRMIIRQTDTHRSKLAQYQATQHSNQAYDVSEDDIALRGYSSSNTDARLDPVSELRGRSTYYTCMSDRPSYSLRDDQRRDDEFDDSRVYRRRPVIENVTASRRNSSSKSSKKIFWQFLVVVMFAFMIFAILQFSGFIYVCSPPKLLGLGEND